MLIVGAVVIEFKILSDIIITILCTVLVFQSTVVVSLCGYAIYIQPVGTAAAALNLSTYYLLVEVGDSGGFLSILSGDESLLLLQ
jgi:hypothetical protein